MAVTKVRKNISLNVGQPNNFELICAMQDDNKAFEITATIYNGNELYEVAGMIRLKGENSVGNSIYKEVDSFTSHTITFTLTEDMLRYDGLLKLVLVMTGNGTQITTFPFIVKVVNSPGRDNADDIQAISALIEEAKHWADLSKSYAIGTDDEVRDGDSIDNSKYYYEQTRDLIENTDFGNGNILYFETYDEFLSDYNNDKIAPETLIVIKEKLLIKANQNIPVFKAGDLVRIGIGLPEYQFLNDDNETIEVIEKIDGVTQYLLKDDTKINTIKNTLMGSRDQYNDKSICKFNNKYYFILNNHLYISDNLVDIYEKDLSFMSYGNRFAVYIQSTNNKIFITNLRKLYISDDGDNWIETNFSIDYPIGSSDNPNSYMGEEYKGTIDNILYYNEKYIMSTVYGRYYISLDGVNWSNAHVELEEFEHFSYLNRSGDNLIMIKTPNCRSGNSHSIIIYKYYNEENWNLLVNDITSLNIKPQILSYGDPHSDFKYMYINNCHFVFLYNSIIKYDENGVSTIIYKTEYKDLNGNYVTGGNIVIDITNNTNLSDDDVDSWFYCYRAIKYNNSIIISPRLSNYSYISVDGENYDIFLEFNMDSFYEITDESNKEVEFYR